MKEAERIWTNLLLYPLKKLLRKGKSAAHQVFLQHSCHRVNLNRDILRQLETSFMETVNKFLLLSKPKCKQECLMILQIHHEWTFTILHMLLTCQLQHFTFDWEAINTITRSLTRVFKTSFETTLARKWLLMGILTLRVACIWTISHFKALSSISLFLWFLRTVPQAGRMTSSNFMKTPSVYAWTSGPIMLECFCFGISILWLFREMTNWKTPCSPFLVLLGIQRQDSISISALSFHTFYSHYHHLNQTQFSSWYNLPFLNFVLLIPLIAWGLLSPQHQHPNVHYPRGACGWTQASTETGHPPHSSCSVSLCFLITLSPLQAKIPLSSD